MLTISLVNQFAAKVKELFWTKGLSEISNEIEMTAALFYCAKATVTLEQVQSAYKNDKGGKLITRLSQKIVKTLSSTDRTLRNNVSWSGELIWMRFSLTCMLVLVWREDNHTLL